MTESNPMTKEKLLELVVNTMPSKCTDYEFHCADLMLWVTWHNHRLRIGWPLMVMEVKGEIEESNEIAILVRTLLERAYVES